jgi:cyanophycinase
MNRSSLALVLLTSLLAAQESRPSPAIVIGGGADQPAIIKKFIDLSGGADAKILVVPISTVQANPGQAMAEFIREGGGKNVGVWIPTRSSIDSDESLNELRSARGLYFTGGNQNRGMNLLRGTKAVEVIREQHRMGKATIAGSSAGAALMSKVMIEGAPPEGAISPGRFATSDGLGVTGTWITDQHFLARARLQRLLNVLMDTPGYRGMGVDEKTAAVIDGDTIEVIGQGQVLLVEPPTGVTSRPVDGRPLYRSDEIKIRVLVAGDRVKVS